MTRSRLPSGSGYAQFSVLGDVRFTRTVADNLGYYRLNGRAPAAIDAAGQAGLAALGLAGVPNAASRQIRRQGAPGTLGGSATATLLRANLPDMVLAGTTPVAGAHDHPLVSDTQIFNSGNAGQRKQSGTRLPGRSTTVIANDNIHDHTFTASFGGADTPIAITRSTFSLYAAICLDASLPNTWLEIDGDVKNSWLTADHGGWVLLDGRLKVLLTPTQQAVATALGMGVNIPNATGAVLKMNGPLYSTGGSDTNTILAANLPATGIAASSSISIPTHTHALNEPQIFGGGGGGNGPVPANNGGVRAPYEGAADITAGGAHSHDYSIALTGGGVPLVTRPPFISMSSFIWLGL